MTDEQAIQEIIEVTGQRVKKLEAQLRLSEQHVEGLESSMRLANRENEKLAGDVEARDKMLEIARDAMCSKCNSYECESQSCIYSNKLQKIEQALQPPKETNG
jgi:hypothetical protein